MLQDLGLLIHKKTAITHNEIIESIAITAVIVTITAFPRPFSA